MTIRFVVPGAPRGKARPRFANGHAYTDEKTREYEQLIAFMYKKNAKGYMFPDDVPLAIRIHTYHPIPKSASKKKHAEMLHGDIVPTVKPDADNIVKCIMDALNKNAYADDKQVVFLTVQKHYAEEPCVSVEIYNIAEKDEE